MSALQADRDALDAIAVQQDTVRTLMLLELETTRLHTTSEAQATKQLVTNESLAIREHNNANQRSTEQLLVSQATDIVTQIVHSRQELQAHIDNTAKTQTQQLQRDMAHSRIHIQVELEQQVRRLQEENASDLEIERFLNQWQITQLANEAVKSQEAQSAQTHLAWMNMHASQMREQMERHRSYYDDLAKRQIEVRQQNDDTKLHRDVLVDHMPAEVPQKSQLNTHKTSARSSKSRRLQMEASQILEDMQIITAKPYDDPSLDQLEAVRFVAWIPWEGPDLIVLAQYIWRFVDHNATTRRSRSLQGPDRMGVTVTAKEAALSMESLLATLEDAELWVNEQEQGRYLHDPYPYINSATWSARLRSRLLPEHEQLLGETSPASKRRARPGEVKEFPDLFKPLRRSEARMDERYRPRLNEMSYDYH